MSKTKLKRKVRHDYDSTVEQVNELGDALNTFNLAALGGMPPETLKRLIASKLGKSVFPKTRKIGYALVASPNPIDQINALRQQLALALNKD